MTEPETITTTEHWPNGHIREITRRINISGARHGRQQSWYEGGQPQYDGTYERGKPHGRQLKLSGRRWF